MRAATTMRWDQRISRVATILRWLQPSDTNGKHPWRKSEPQSKHLLWLLHLATNMSPTCTGYSSLCNINKRKAKYTTKRRWGSQRALRAFCRRLHEVFHANTALPLKSRSHEYSAVSRTVIGRVFPFAISHRCPQVVVSACVCGLRFGGKPCCKAFCFESDHSGMVWVLRALSCPGHHDRSYVISESGRKAVQKTSETEKYTPALGLLLQKSCSLRDAIVLDKASIVPSPP